MDWNEFHEAVYSQDAAKEEPFGWIQWKGTDACIDLHCKCGQHDHIDADFLYYYQCSSCGARYALGSVVKLIELTDEQAAYAETRHAFRKDE